LFVVAAPDADPFFQTALADMKFVAVPFAEFTVVINKSLFGGKGGKLCYIVAPTPAPTSDRVSELFS
jgi:hypothetical protein